MYDFISLSVKCPHCKKSLMDEETLVDNQPGVKLKITLDNNEGIIHLSPIYGSYNYSTNLKIAPGKVVTFSCPHCNEVLVSELKCDECDATMVPLEIEGGGIVRICSRAGCKKHSVEFEDLSTALEYFYRSHGYGKGVQDKNVVHEKKEETPTTIRKKGDKEIIESGTFLRVYCPHCDESLIEDNSVKFKITHDDNKEGFLMLSPYLNVFTNESTIYIPEGEVVKKIDCPHCNTSLIIKGKKCELCGSNIVGVSIAALSKYIEFYFCSKKGCRWHGLSNEDIDDIMLEDSEEW